MSIQDQVLDRFTYFFNTVPGHQVSQGWAFLTWISSAKYHFLFFLKTVGGRLILGSDYERWKIGDFYRLV